MHERLPRLKRYFSGDILVSSERVAWNPTSYTLARENQISLNFLKNLDKTAIASVPRNELGSIWYVHYYESGVSAIRTNDVYVIVSVRTQKMSVEISAS
jgi:hypothetical protein